MSRLFALLAGFLFLAAPAYPQAQPARAEFQATPSLWHVQGDPRKGELGEVYLLGSVHVLPPDLRWRTPAIASALARSTIFVFEVPQDAAAMAELNGLIQAQGLLPPGQNLRAMLHPASLPDYDAAVAASGLAPAMVEQERPWLAGLQLMFAQIAKLHFTAGSGVDSVVLARAQDDHKPARYLETIAEQFALLAPGDQSLELEEFEASLKELRDIGAEVQPLVRAWSVGDQAKLDELLNGDLDAFPQVRKALLEDRNRRWLPKIQTMLQEKQVFFITVGAGHLTGRQGLPALLRAAGHTVRGP